MSSADGNKALAKEFEEVVSNDMQNVMQKAREADPSDAFRRITRSMAKAEGEMPTKQKNSQGLDEPATRMVVLALPAPYQALYEKNTNQASKPRKMLDEEAAMQTGEGKEAPNELRDRVV